MQKTKGEEEEEEEDETRTSFIEKGEERAMKKCVLWLSPSLVL